MSMRGPRRFAIIFALTAVLATTLASSPAAITRARDKPIPVGVVRLTDAYDFYGLETETAIDLAVEELEGRFRITYLHSGGDALEAVSAFTELVSTGDVRLITTSASWISEAIYPHAAERGVFQSVLASAALDRDREDRAVRFTVDVADEAAYLDSFLSRFERIGILYMDNSFGAGWQERLRLHLGAKVLSSQRYPIGAAAFDAELAKLSDLDLDALVLLATGVEGALIARQARDLGISAQLVGTRPIETPELVGDPAAVEGLVYTYPYFDTEHPFVDRYIARYERRPTVFAAEAYDAIITLAQATSECGTDTACIHEWYRGRTYDGALGHVVFDSRGDAHYPFILKHVRNGAFVAYESSE